MTVLITQEHKLMAEPAATILAGSIRSSSETVQTAERAETASNSSELKATENNVFLLLAARGSKLSAMGHARLALITRGNRTTAAAD